MKIAIIGSGSSAFAAAIHAAEKGAKVTMIEKSPIIGGTCVNIGCVPSKIFIQQAFVAHTQQQHPFKGVARQAPIIQRRLLAEQQQARVAELRQAKYENILADNPNITLIQGTASFKDQHTLTVTDNQGQLQEVQADRILIATGSTPTLPAIPGLKDTPYWTSTEALESEVMPQHLVVIGASFVAIEIAQAYLRLGAKVTLLARSTLLSKDDPEIGNALQAILAEEGMRILTYTVPQAIAHDGSHFHVNLGNEIIQGDKLLVAAGRHANTERLNLAAIGVKTDTTGHIVVDRYMQTSVETIYATGDCTIQPKYVYVAAAAGTRAAANMLGGQVALDLSIVPGVTFSDPQVATVGLTEAQAKEMQIEVESRTLGLENVPRALVNFNTRGFIKLVAEKQTGQLVGAHILAAEAGEIIQTATLAIRNRMTVKELASQLFPYLTMVEGLKLCAQIFNKDVKKLSCCADAMTTEMEEKGEASHPRGIAHNTASFWQPLMKRQVAEQQLKAQPEETEHDCCKKNFCS